MGSRFPADAEDEWHHVEKHLLRLHHRVRHSGLRHVLRHHLLLRDEHRPSHDDDEDACEELDGNARVCEDCRQRNSEDRRLLCLNREILSESADGADRSVGHLGHVVDNTEEREEDRHLHEERQTRGPGAGLVVAEQIHLLFGHGLTRVLVLLALVLGLQALNLRLQQLHLALRFDLIDEQRNQDRTNHESQSRDRQHPGPTVQPRPAGRSP